VPLLVLLAVAGCGGGETERDAAPPFPPGLAAQLAGRSDAVAARLEADDPCAALAEAQALQAETIAAVNAGRVPAHYQEELGAAVAALVASIACTPVPAAAGADEEARDLGEWLRASSG
jgi:hypothetical protein